MKLELKHLAGYLPYGLECTDGELLGIINWMGYYGSFKYSGAIKYIGIKNIKPILKPLSDLNKGNGDFLTSDFYLNLCAENNGYGLDILRLSYQDAIELFKRHYDVFELIEAGLAIDINTL